MFGKPAFSLSAAQNTGISTLYRNSYGAPAEDIKHNQVSTETKMLLFQMAKDWCNIVYGNGKNLNITNKQIASCRILLVCPNQTPVFEYGN